MGSSGPRKLDISYPTNEFIKLVKMWDKYDPETMGVIVRYIKRCALIVPSLSPRIDVGLTNSSALPSYVHEGREPDPVVKVGGIKRSNPSKVRLTSLCSQELSLPFPFPPPRRSSLTAASLHSQLHYRRVSLSVQSSVRTGAATPRSLPTRRQYRRRWTKILPAARRRNCGHPPSSPKGPPRSHQGSIR